MLHKNSNKPEVGSYYYFSEIPRI